MKIRGTHIYFRSNWSGDSAWFRRNSRPNTYFYAGETPFWFAHKYVSKRFNTDLLFEKWHNRTIKIKRKNSINRLYWRNHKDEWSKIYKSIKK